MVSKDVKNKKIITCTECGAENPDQSVFCGYCGKKLESTPKTESNDKIQKYCQICGKKIITGSRFCGNCGTKFTSSMQSNIRPANTHDEISREEYSQPDIYPEIDNWKPSTKKVINKSESEWKKELDELTLTPAESMMIIDLDIDGYDLLKITLLDLLARSVITFDTIKVETGLILKNQKFIRTVKMGRNFPIALRPHEEIFTIALYKDGMNLSEYAHRLVQHFTSDGKKADFELYKNKLIRDQLVEAGYLDRVKTDLKYKNSDVVYQLTNYATVVKVNLHKLIEQGKNLEKWIFEDKERAKAYLEACGTNIFLLDDYDLATFYEFRNMVADVRLNKILYKKYLLLTTPFVMFAALNSEKKIKDKFDLDSNNFDWESTNLNFELVRSDLAYIDFKTFESLNELFNILIF